MPLVERARVEVYVPDLPAPRNLSLLIVTNMSARFDDIEILVRSLPLKEKVALARVLIEELDTSVDANSEQLWIAEAQRRYDAYLKGELEALPGDDVMKRARRSMGAIARPFGHGE